MNHQYHFGSPNYPLLKEVAQVSALISDLDRVVRALESNIAAEEERSGVSDPFNANYPILARMMTARRNNLKETIEALERRLSSKQSKLIEPA
jgi:septation ring formation regulator EzrA